jgi:plasmid stabilization system protein ParE
MKLIVTRTAQADLARLKKFLEDKNPSAANRAASKIAGAIESLKVFPQRGGAFGDSNFRHLAIPYGRAFYVIRYAYRAEIDEVLVLRVWHGREARD